MRTASPLHVACLLLAAMPVVAQTAADANPFFADWSTPFGVPPFDKIKEDHFLPAYKEAIARHMKEIEAIANDPAAPTFANTLEALEASGALLDKVGGVFGNLQSSETNEKLQAITPFPDPT